MFKHSIYVQTLLSASATDTTNSGSMTEQTEQHVNEQLCRRSMFHFGGEQTQVENLLHVGAVKRFKLKLSTASAAPAAAQHRSSLQIIHREKPAETFSSSKHGWSGS